MRTQLSIFFLSFVMSLVTSPLISLMLPLFSCNSMRSLRWSNSPCSDSLRLKEVWQLCVMNVLRILATTGRLGWAINEPILISTRLLENGNPFKVRSEYRILKANILVVLLCSRTPLDPCIFTRLLHHFFAFKSLSTFLSITTKRPLPHCCQKE